MRADEPAQSGRARPLSVEGWNWPADVVNAWCDMPRVIERYALHLVKGKEIEQRASSEKLVDGLKLR